jgi:ligand-binding sensor protein
MGYRLEDLIDIEQFQGLQDRMNELYSLPTAIIDCDGNILTATGSQDVCSEFHHRSRDCESECLRSALYSPSHPPGNNPIAHYRCPRGLVDNIIPIIINDQHYANFYTGQFFLEEPDLDVFRTQALKFGFDQEAYLDAIKKVPIYSLEQVQSHLQFINSLIKLLSSSGLKKLQALEAHKKGEEHKERAGAILSQMSDGFWMIDACGGKIVDVNPAMCEMLGYSRGRWKDCRR